MIEAKAVSKSFDGFLALNDLDMTVPKGSIYGLVGPNGAGKSTLLSVVTNRLLPTAGEHPVMLIDCGATAECTPEFLLQFAFMGSYYAERVLGRPEPKVGLLNIGAEPSKGTDLQREAYGLLQKASDEGRINFVGNVEAREAVSGSVDVIVSDGYSGNIFLKLSLIHI